LRALGKPGRAFDVAIVQGHDAREYARFRCDLHRLAIDFWQDVAIDWQKDRIYLPLQDMARFGVGEAHLSGELCDARFRALLGAKVEQAREMLVSGSGLALRMPGRFGLELCLVVHGGLRILERIEKADYDVFRHRPVLGALDWFHVLRRAVAMRFLRRPPSFQTA